MAFPTVFSRPFRPALGGDVTAASFSPLDISPLQAWIDFADISTLFQDSARTIPVTADGDPIGGVVNKGLNGINASQTTTSKQPQYKAGIKNGLGVARFDTADDELNIPFTQTTDTTVIWVCGNQQASPSLSYRTLVVYLGSNNYLAAGHIVYLNSLSAGHWNGVVYANASTEGVSDWSQFFVRSLMYDADPRATLGWVNGVQSTGSNSAGTTVANRLYKGIGDVCEYLSWNRLLTNDERQAVEMYLNAKWAVY